MRKIFILFIFLSSLISYSPKVFADTCPPNIFRKIKKLHKLAMEDYDQMEFTSARKTMEDAISIARRESCDNTLEYANILVDLGIMYITDPDNPDESRGRLSFKRAIRINPCAKINPDLATPKLNRILKSVKKRNHVVCKPGFKVGNTATSSTSSSSTSTHASTSSSSSSQSANTTETPVKREIEEEDNGPEPSVIEHEPPDEAPQLSPLTIRCRVPKKGGIKKVVLYYRKPGEEAYTAIPMDNYSGYSWKAVVPGSDVKGAVFQYYITALNSSGKPVMGNANSGAPNIITLTKPKHKTETEECDDPLHPENCNKSSSSSDSSETGKSSSNNKKVKWHMVLGGRWGAGYLSTSMCSSLARDSSDPTVCGGQGVHIATPGFAYGELGGELGLYYFVGDSVSLGLNIKSGFVKSDYAESGSNPYGVGVTALMKAQWFPTGKDSVFRPYLGAGLGGGQMFHVWQVDETAGKQDTFLHGWIMTDLTLGFQVGSPKAAFYFNVDTIVVFPEQSTIHIDITGGLMIGF